MARRNLLRSWLAAALSVVAVLAVGLLTVRPVPAGAADRRLFTITVSEAGYNPPIVVDVNVGDILMFALDPGTTEKHTVTFEDNSVCPGNRGAVPCWPELRFDDGRPNCLDGNGIKSGHRCMIVQDPGKTVQYHDAFNASNIGEIRVLGQATTTTGPSTTTTTAPTSTTTTTQPPTTSTTWSDTTTTTAPTQIRPFVIPDSPSTTSTMAPAPVAVTTTAGTPASTANKDRDKDKGKAKAKAAETETPTTAAPAPPDALPETVFDPAALTPGLVQLPDTPGDAEDEVDLESAAVMNLLDGEKAADDRPLLLALAALAFLLAVGGIWHWFHRASRYDPA